MKSCSYTGSNAISTARWSTLSSSVGIPIGRVLPVPGLSKCTRRTAGARYRPDLNRSSKLDRFASRSVSYCAAVTPSTPAAASLRTRRYASPIHTASMGCASVVMTSFGSLRANSAILRCRVEMTSRPNVPAICPSASSTARSAASLHRVPSGQVPRLLRDYRPTPTSRLPSRLASSPSLGTTTACAPLRSHGAGTRSPWTRTISHRGARAASARWRRRDLPGSWTTLAYMPRSSTPTERRPQARSGPAMASSAMQTASTPRR